MQRGGGGGGWGVQTSSSRVLSSLSDSKDSNNCTRDFTPIP